MQGLKSETWGGLRDVCDWQTGVLTLAQRQEESAGLWPLKFASFNRHLG